VGWNWWFLGWFLTVFDVDILLLDLLFGRGYAARQLKQWIKQSRCSAAAFLLI
jgi:hypothetical protein